MSYSFVWRSHYSEQFTWPVIIFVFFRGHLQILHSSPLLLQSPHIVFLITRYGSVTVIYVVRCSDKTYYFLMQIPSRTGSTELFLFFHFYTNGSHLVLKFFYWFVNTAECMFALVEYINLFMFALKYLIRFKNNRSTSHMMNCNNMVCSSRKPVCWCEENAFQPISSHS